MAEQAAEQHHGDQDIAEQVRTYAAFNTLTKWASLTFGSLLVLLILWFCTSVGFVGALVTAVIVAVAGVVFLRRSPAEEH